MRHTMQTYTCFRREKTQNSTLIRLLEFSISVIRLRVFTVRVRFSLSMTSSASRWSSLPILVPPDFKRWSDSWQAAHWWKRIVAYKVSNAGLCFTFCQFVDGCSICGNRENCWKKCDSYWSDKHRLWVLQHDKFCKLTMKVFRQVDVLCVAQW